MNIITKGAATFFLTVALLLDSAPGQAAIYEYLSTEHSYRIDGRVRQNITVGYGRSKRENRTDNFDITGSEYLAELSQNYSYYDWIRAKLVLNLHGDSMYAIRKNDRNFGSRGANIRTGDNGGFVPYGHDAESEVVRDGCRNSGSCSNFLRDYLIRELSVTFADRDNGYNIQIGKFQRGWGQADGLRLMDVLNPLDFRKRFLFRDFDELRIEQWMLDATFFTEPFIRSSQYGIHNPNFEFIWIPNVRHTEFRANNAYTGENGGIWGIDLPSRFGPLGPIPDRVFLTTRRETATGSSWWNWKEPTVAGRIAWNMLQTDLTISGYYGWQDLFVSRLDGAKLFLGPSGRRGPGGNTPLLDNIDPSLSRTALGLVNQGLFNLGTCTPAVPGVLPAQLLNALPLNPTNGCSVEGNVDLDFRERKRLIGFTLTRELSLFHLPPRGVSPILRIETSYEFHKPFNTTQVVGPDSITTRKLDFWSTMAGFDYFFWLPSDFYERDWTRKWLFSQPRAIFTSGQMFMFKAMGNGAGNRRVLWQSPYTDWKRPSNEFWFTFLWFTDVYKDLIHLEGLNVFELQNSGFAVRQRADIRLFGDNFVPRLELIHLEGKGDQSTGVFDNNDQIDLQLLYQF